MKKIIMGIQDFKELKNIGAYYVDKTQVIYNILNNNKYCFLSRPRRFGKSLTLSMIKYLYLGEKELFKNTFIFDKWDFSQTNPVIYISLAGYSKLEKNLDEFIKRNLYIYIEDKTYKYTDFMENLDIGYLSQLIFEKTGKQSVILVDEYDKVVLSHLQDTQKAEELREYFGGMYAGIKDADPYIKMFLLTGLTKILKMNIFSSLNNLKDISFDPVGYNIMGYNWNDIEINFSEELEEIGKKHNLSIDKVKDKCKLMYNGYNFGSEDGDTIFNPWNINNLMLDRKFEYYWSNTGIPSAIVDYVKAQNIDVVSIVEKINNKELTVSEIQLKLEKLDNITAEVFFLNSGYLTITRQINNVYYLDYPNKETKTVMLEFFISLLRPRYDFSLIIKISNLFYKGITEQNEECLKEGFNLLVYKFLNDTPYDWIKNNPEGWLKSFFGMILIMNTLGYYGEVQNVGGRKDMVITKDNKYFVLEIKVNESIKKAIEQIDKIYVPFLQDGKEIVKIGINWNKRKKSFDIGFF